MNSPIESVLDSSSATPLMSSCWLHPSFLYSLCPPIWFFLLVFFLGGVGYFYTFRSGLLEYLWHVPLTGSYGTDIISRVPRTWRRSHKDSKYHIQCSLFQRLQLVQTLHNNIMIYRNESLSLGSNTAVSSLQPQEPRNEEAEIMKL